MTKRILVTGSREWSDREHMREVLEDYGQSLDSWDDFETPYILVHGDARGADRMAAEIWNKTGNPCEPHPAKWDRKLDGSYNKLAGFQRNQKMVDLGANICIAFLKIGAANRGTRDCIERARKAGIEVIEVWGG